MQCSHFNREHTLIYIKSGELEINERGKVTRLSKGQCAFIRRDNQVLLTKLVKEDNPYCSVVLKFSRKFLREFYQTIDKLTIPDKVKRGKISLCLLPENRPDITSLFESVIPYFESNAIPSEELLKLKMIEGLYVLLNTDKNLYASLFDFIEPWKIDKLDYMNDNYMYDLSMKERASFTGRSLATFKRDFRKYSDLPPQKWLVKRRLEAAREMIRENKKKVTEICFDVGFKNLSTKLFEPYDKAAAECPLYLCLKFKTRSSMENNREMQVSGNVVSRRGFLKTSALVGTALIIPSGVSKVIATEPENKSLPQTGGGTAMISEYRVLGSGKAAMEVSALGFGCIR